MLNRRNILAAGSAALAVSALPRAAMAQANTITGVTWGGPWIAACKALAAKQPTPVNWVLHEGGSANIIAKIAASWPRVNMDFVHGTPGVTHPMMLRGWVEPFTAADIPNLKLIPPEALYKNEKGEIVFIPVSGTGSLWAYDQAAIGGMKIEKPEDLFAPALRGKILATPPSYQFGRFLLSLAMARGGNERNMDAGFEFAKELAKAKAIGRIVKSDAELNNAFASGEVALGLVNASNFLEISKTRKLTPLNRVPDSKMFKTFLVYEGFTVLNSTKNRKEVMDFLNFFVGEKVNEEYAAAIGHAPMNINSAIPASAAITQPKDAEERAKFGYIPDVSYAATQVPEWNRRWELDVMPLLR